MANIVDYVCGAEGAALRLNGMNDADALALALLAGMDWGDRADGRTLRDAARDMPATDWPELGRLARAMADSERFGGLGLYAFERADMLEPALQFAAVTIWDGHDAYLAYRGTDGSLAGWFEDIQLAYAEPVPAQTRAHGYMMNAARRFPGGLYLGGHSKGGALALYAGVSAGLAQPRVRRVYSFDGPGMSRAAFESQEYADLRGRLLNVVPVRSVVGMLLWQDGETRVVRSDERGVRQHDPFSWLTDARGLEYAAELSLASRRLREVARALLEALPREDLERLGQALYELVLSTGARTLAELSDYLAGHPEMLSQAPGAVDGRALYMLIYMVAAAGLDADTAPFAELEPGQESAGLSGAG